MAIHNTKTCSNPNCTCNHLTPLLIPRKKAANLLGISVRSLAYLTAEGRLKTRKIGGRTLIAYQELKRFSSRDSVSSMKPQPASREDE